VQQGRLFVPKNDDVKCEPRENEHPAHRVVYDLRKADLLWPPLRHQLDCLMLHAGLCYDPHWRSCTGADPAAWGRQQYDAHVWLLTLL
jgi:hypothetical protein